MQNKKEKEEKERQKGRKKRERKNVWKVTSSIMIYIKK
jgi:hypothetical protein